MILKAYKYRIYPNLVQGSLIDKTIGVCRFVYNLAVETKLYAYKSHGKNLTSFDLCYQLVDLKKECQWICEVDSQAVQASVKKIDKSFQNFFRGKGFPKFKSKRSSGSFQCPNGVRKINWDKSTLTIPKIKDIPIELSRSFEGKIKTVTISKTPTGKYFASILVETTYINKLPNLVSTETSIGVDVGIKDFVISSDGRKFEANRRLKNSLKRLKCLQRRASRRKRGSNNRKKANLYVSVLHEKITNQRTDYIHKVTTGLIRDNQTETIVIEDLNVAGMLKNRKLSQAISDVSFGEFYRQLAYKCEWYGVNLIKIGRFDPSSKRCSDCGEINQELTLADREWTCKCGSTHDRDFNAAKNIKWFGLNKSPEGIRVEPVESRRLRRAKKQESILD
jgi:putative transposase